MVTRRCVCPGSYDPVTNGHLDVVRRAAGMFDEVVVAVLTNPAKRGLFSLDERLALIDAALAESSNSSDASGDHLRSRVRVETMDGVLLVDFCRRVGAAAVVKGLRSGTDLAYELPMALMNRHLTGLETVFLAGDPTLSHVSSSLVKEVALLGGDVSALVPSAVHEALVARRPDSSV